MRLQEIQPSRSYLPAWISKPLQRSRLPSYDSEIGSSALPSPNLANTIHGSLHGASNFADRQWQGEAQAPPARPRSVTPPRLRVLGDSEGWLSREVGHSHALALNPPLQCAQFPQLVLAALATELCIGCKVTLWPMGGHDIKQI